MDKHQELEALCTPLVKFLADNYNPHCAVVITSDQIRVVGDELSIPVKKQGQSED